MLTMRQKAERILEELNANMRKSDRLEDRIEKAEKDGNMERAAKLEAIDDVVVGKISTLVWTLQVLGYSVTCDRDDVYKINGEG